MKKSFLGFIFLFIVTAAIAQKDFEGTIMFKISVEGTDAAKLATMMPESYTFMFKGEDLKILIQGGYMSLLMGPIIVKGGKTYMIKEEKKTAYIIPDDKKKNAPKPNVKLTKLGASDKILGYPCDKFKVEEKDDKGKLVTSYIWTTSAIKVDNFKKNQQTIDMQMVYEGMTGFPMKVESSVSSSNMNYKVTMLVTKVIPAVLGANVFQIPADYKIEELGPGAFLKQQ